MSSKRSTVLAALATVLAGIAVFVVFDILRYKERITNFESDARDIGSLEAVNGVPFPTTRGHAIVTEPLAHVSFLPGRTLLGKQLVVHTRFHLDEGDVLEVGVKKTAFWLDYDRRPLAHRTLDTLLERPGGWKVLNSGTRVVALNPRFNNPWNTVEEFERHPPTDGLIGVYGNAILPTSGSGSPTPATGPFRASDTLDSFRAIYAQYQRPTKREPEWTENEQRFDLSRVFQNEDGTIDIMFFLQRRDGGPIRVLVDEIRFSVESGWPGPKDLLAITRRSLVQLVKRPPAKQ